MESEIKEYLRHLGMKGIYMNMMNCSNIGIKYLVTDQERQEFDEIVEKLQNYLSYKLEKGQDLVRYYSKLEEQNKRYKKLHDKKYVQVQKILQNNFFEFSEINLHHLSKKQSSKLLDIIDGNLNRLFKNLHQNPKNDQIKLRCSYRFITGGKKSTEIVYSHVEQYFKDKYKQQCIKDLSKNQYCVGWLGSLLKSSQIIYLTYFEQESISDVISELISLAKKKKTQIKLYYSNIKKIQQEIKRQSDGRLNIIYDPKKQWVKFKLTDQ